MNEKIQKLREIVVDYNKVIKKFKARADVQSGKALGYRKNQDPNGELTFENTPKGIGDGLSTTGWCVSASQALLNDNIFKYFLESRGAFARLFSIDIKERFYGKCYSGSKNKWHTAILVEDSCYVFVIDLTCAQFGNNFINKDIWEFDLWEKTFRSESDTHIILDKFDKPLTTLPKFKTNKNLCLDWLSKTNTEKSLDDYPSMFGVDKKHLLDFFFDNVKNPFFIDKINNNLMIGNVSNKILTFIDGLNKSLKHLPFVNTSNLTTNTDSYCILKFETIEALKNWLEKTLASSNKLTFDDGITNTIITNKLYLIFHQSLEEAAKNNSIDFNQLNIESLNNERYLILKLRKTYGVSLEFLKYSDEKNSKPKILLPPGIILKSNVDSDIYNSSKLIKNFEGVGLFTKELDNTLDTVKPLTNTIYFEFDLY